MIAGLDIGSTTLKAVVCDEGRVLWRDYQRHHTRQAEMTLAFLSRMEAECGLTPGRDRLFATGSGAGLLAPLLGARLVQEVVAVAAAVERLYPDVRFVSEIGGEDMKTVFFTPAAAGKTRQVFMQSACSGGTGTFIEKAARKLQMPPEVLARTPYDGSPIHAISSKCGIFAEADVNTLLKSGVPPHEIVASLFEAVVHQNLATLTKGNTPVPPVLLLGGPNLFFEGLQQAWRHHLRRLWADRRTPLDASLDPAALVCVPDDAVYFACLGCVAIGEEEAGDTAIYAGQAALRAWVDVGQQQHKTQDGVPGLAANASELAAFLDRYSGAAATRDRRPQPSPPASDAEVVVGCDLGSTTAKAVVLTPDRQVAFCAYAASKGNPIEDARALFAQIRAAGYERIGALSLTGYGKDLLTDVLGADLAIVETVAHATAALHFFPEADVICDVGGCDVKIMLLRHGTVSDFRLNSQCSSGNGAFLQGVAERYDVPLDDYAAHAFQARAMPSLTMGCGVFLQSDIVNQQRKGWSADEIMASLAAVLPVNVWVYAGQLQNLRAAGRTFVLQGGTHRNLAVVKAQVDFIRSKAPDADIVVHPYAGEAGAIGAALCALDGWRAGQTTRFRGFAAIAGLEYTSTTSEQTVCHWCSCHCKRTFIDVNLPGAAGRPWSKVPLAAGQARVISGNSCARGLVEDVEEMRVVKVRLEGLKRDYPNVADMVRTEAFRRPRAAGAPADRHPAGA